MTTWTHRCTLLWGCLFGCLFHVGEPLGSAKSLQAPEPLQNAEDSVEVQEGYQTPFSPCSCDCCLVAERSPAEIVKVQEKNGDEDLLTRKCVAPPESYQTQTCGKACFPSKSDVVLAAVQTNMDYQRFCQYLCRPATKTVGTVCFKLDSEDIAYAFNFDGNGNADSAAFKAFGDGEEWWGVGSRSSSSKSREQAYENAKAASSTKASVDYDMRKVISERTRSEAASNIARAAAAEAHVKANRLSTEHAQRKTQKVSDAIAATAGAAGGSEVAAAAAAADAKAAAAGARAALAAGRAAAANAVPNAKALAREMIKKEVEGLAKKEALADNFLYGYDKPPNWAKIVAQETADLYLKPMAVVSYRATEYKGWAKGLLGQAKAAQGKARAAMNQANQYKAMGNIPQANVMYQEVKGLVSQSHALEAQSKKMWQTAADAYKSISEWQQAGTLAAGRAGWEYKMYFSTPPPAAGPPWEFEKPTEGRYLGTKWAQNWAGSEPYYDMA